MADASVPSAQPAATPHELLANLRDLTRRVRTEQRDAWFPLLLLGILLAAGILVGRLTFRLDVIPCPPGAVPPGPLPADPVCTRAQSGSPFYWTAGLLAVYLATTFFYVWRSRLRGVGSVVRPYLIAGFVVLLLVLPVRFWDVGRTTPPGAAVDLWGLHFHASSGTTEFLTRLTGRALSIGVPLLVLAWVERNRALLLFTLGYLVIELVPVVPPRGGVGPLSPWATLPTLGVGALYFLGGALGFWLARRRGGQSAAS